MKLSKEKLKQIISEELNEMEAELGKDRVSTADVRSGASSSAKAQGAQGITSQERGLIKQLSDMLVAGAQESNLLSGTIIARVKQLAAELQKLQKAPAQGEQQ